MKRCAMSVPYNCFVGNGTTSCCYVDIHERKKTVQSVACRQLKAQPTQGGVYRILRIYEMSQLVACQNSREGSHATTACQRLKCRQVTSQLCIWQLRVYIFQLLLSFGHRGYVNIGCRVRTDRTKAHSGAQVMTSNYRKVEHVFSRGNAS